MVPDNAFAVISFFDLELLINSSIDDKEKENIIKSFKTVEKLVESKQVELNQFMKDLKQQVEASRNTFENTEGFLAKPPEVIAREKMEEIQREVSENPEVIYFEKEVKPIFNVLVSASNIAVIKPFPCTVFRKEISNDESLVDTRLTLGTKIVYYGGASVIVLEKPERVIGLIQQTMQQIGEAVMSAQERNQIREMLAGNIPASMQGMPAGMPAGMNDPQTRQRRRH